MSERRVSGILRVSVGCVALALLFGCAAQQAAGLNERAAKELAAQKPELAEASLRASIAKSDTPLARARLGRLLASRKACDEALPHLEKGLAYAPLAAEVSADKARCLFSQKQYPLAAEAFLVAIAQAPGNHDLLLETAPLWPELDAHPRLTLWLNELVRLTPNQHYALAFLANHYYRTKNYKDAHEAFSAAEAIFAQSSALYLHHAASLLAAGEFASAATQFERAQTLSPATDAAIGLAFARYKLGQNKEALTALNAALALNPNQVQALSFKAQILFEAREYDEALTLIERALKARPGTPELLAFKGRLLFEKGEAALALGAVNEALERAAQAKTAAQAEWLETKGAALLALNRPSEAREALIAALTQDSQRNGSLRRLGIALYQEKLYPPALKALREALKRDPQNSEALLYAGLAAFENGTDTWPDAKVWLGAAMKEQGKSPLAHARLAAILAYQGNSKEALAQLGEAIRLGFNDAGFLKHEAFKKLTTDKAFQAYKKQLDKK